MLDNAREAVSHLTSETVKSIDGHLENVELLSKTVLELNSMKTLNSEELDQVMHNLIYDNSELISICIADNPKASGVLQTRTLFHKHNQAIIVRNTDPNYQYEDWFQIPFETQKRYWTEPWYDSSGPGKIVISYSQPVFDKGRVVSILRFDTELSYLQSQVSPLRLKNSGYAFLISNLGTIITHPADSLVMDHTIFSLAEEFEDTGLREIGRSMVNGDVNFTRVRGSSPFNDAWVYYAPLLSNNWSIGVVISNVDVMRDLNLLLIIQTLISIIVFLTISIIVYSRTLSVSKPLWTLSNIAEKIGNGDFDSQLPEISKTYEIHRLNQAFSAMQCSLRNYIHSLESTNQEKNRILTEVRFASEIQKNLIPSNTEHPYGINALRVYGIFEPASDIGGDLYDYFMVDENHFCFAIADVVGKGIVAAMTMTIVSTFLRTVSAYHRRCNVILQELNNFLCSNNIEANFVTVLLGIIDLETGRLEYSNAGHVPMFIRKMDRSYKKYAETHSTAVGVFEDLPIANESVQLYMGDEIILFTDGITEAMNNQEDFLGIDGMEDIIKKLGAPNPQKSANAILDNVHEFSQSSLEKDDITILVIDYKHPHR